MPLSGHLYFMFFTKNIKSIYNIVMIQYYKLILCFLFPHPLEFFYMPVTQFRYYNIRVLSPHLNNSKYLLKFISCSMEFTTFQDLVLSLYYMRLIFRFDCCYPHLHVHLCPNGRASLSMSHSVRRQSCGCYGAWWNVTGASDT